MISLEIQLTDQIWDHLKLAVIFIAVLAPAMIAFLVVRNKRAIKGLEKKYKSDQKIFEKRIEVYERTGPKLNDIFCFYCYNGNWEELTPPEIVKLKKELDKEINTHAPLFSDDLIKKYAGFMQLCFVAHSGWEHDEKIKSLYELRQQNTSGWQEEWIQFFDTNNVVDAIKMKERYDELIECFKREINPLKG